MLCICDMCRQAVTYASFLDGLQVFGLQASKRFFAQSSLDIRVKFSRQHAQQIDDLLVRSNALQEKRKTDPCNPNQADALQADLAHELCLLHPSFQARRLAAEVAPEVRQGSGGVHREKGRALIRSSERAILDK
jgi:hypothetical protein